MKSRLPTYVGKFCDVNIYETYRFGYGYASAGITLPGIGIIVGKGVLSEEKNIQLLKHEFGHILQFRLVGWFRFYFIIGFSSLLSAWTGGHGKGHQCHWTEYWANHLAAKFFLDTQWPQHSYPLKDISSKTKWWLLA